jgi:hypothetical protein
MEKVTVTKKELQAVARMWGRSHNAERLYEITALIDHGKNYTIDEFVKHCPTSNNNSYVKDCIRGFNVVVDLREMPETATDEERQKVLSHYYDYRWDAEKKRHFAKFKFKHIPEWYNRDEDEFDDRDLEFVPAPRAMKWCSFYGRYGRTVCPWNGQCYNITGGGSLCDIYEKRCRFDDDADSECWWEYNGILWDYVGENYAGMS